MKKKVDLAAQMIRKRIAHADHALAGISSERQLAQDLGLSRTTVRSAISELLEEGTLTRQENGRLEVTRAADEEARRVIGFVTPAVSSTDFEQWREGVEGVLAERLVTVRYLSYAHWADAAIQEALNGFDGMFFIPPAEPIPSWLALKIKQSACRVVILDQDESAAGLPSVTLFPPSAERKLFDHLRELRHTRVDCINVQGEDSVICNRIAVWQNYLAENAMSGQLHSLPVRNPLESGYRLIRDALSEGRPIASALFCTTGPGAIGAMRALHEAGLEAGRDISVCAVNSEGIGRYLLRTLTALESPPRALYLQRAAQWMLGDDDWQGALLTQPQDVPLFKGESTGPASDSILTQNSQLKPKPLALAATN